jgi:acyl-coenzyme A synthetase/AMP-(fatty) acid ligase
LGAVAALVNAWVIILAILTGFFSFFFDRWLPLEPLKHCLLKTGCKLAIIDVERANLFEPIIPQLVTEAGVLRFMVFESHEGKGRWKGMENWDEVMSSYQGDTSTILKEDPGIAPEDNATILFTSGTTGLPSKFPSNSPLNPFHDTPYRRCIEHAAYVPHGLAQCKFQLECRFL